MDHPEILDQLDERLDGVLSPGREEELKRHLSACASCRSSDEAYRSLFASLRVEPRPGFSGRVLARLDEKSAVPVWTWRRFALPVAGILAMAILFISAFSMPDPAWADADRSLSSIANSQWADAGMIQSVSVLAEDTND